MYEDVLCGGSPACPVFLWSDYGEVTLSLFLTAPDSLARMRSSSLNLGRLFSNLSRKEVPFVDDPVVGLVSLISLSTNEPFIFFFTGMFLVDLILSF